MVQCYLAYPLGPGWQSVPNNTQMGCRAYPATPAFTLKKAGIPTSIKQEAPASTMQVASNTCVKIPKKAHKLVVAERDP